MCILVLHGGLACAFFPCIYILAAFWVACVCNGSVGCTNNNYASREKCKKCGQPKELAAMRAVAFPGASVPTHTTYFARPRGAMEQLLNCKKCDAPSPLSTPSSLVNPVTAPRAKRLASEEVVHYLDNKRPNVGQQPSSGLESFQNPGGSRLNSIYPPIPSDDATVPPNWLGLQISRLPPKPTLVGKGAKQWRDGDWMCSNCNNHNYASREQCNRRRLTDILGDLISLLLCTAMADDAKSLNMDPFLLKFDANEVRIAAEFLSNWMPFLTRGLCKSCTRTLSDAVRSLHIGDGAVSTPNMLSVNQCKEDPGNCRAHSTGSTKDSADNFDDADTHSLGSWKDEADQLSEHAPESSLTHETLNSPAQLASPRLKKSWADLALEDELAAEEEYDESNGNVDENDSFSEVTSNVDTKPKVVLSRDQREYIRFKNVQRKKDFICLERVNGKKIVNILDGLELHKGVFSAAEQKRIVSYVEQLLEKGKNGLLKERTYSAPAKWMRGKGRITLQFGCCYNYATDKNGNPPGILKAEIVDPLPQLFKVMIKRLVRWHVLPPSCVPDSCIVNIYEEGDCIPPHIDNHEFVRPFCTVSFLSECEILFGSNLQIKGPGEFEGPATIPLPVGSVLVLTGNGADVAKHSVPAVPSKRISITFRRMDESKRPTGYTPEPDLQGLQPLLDEEDRSSKYSSSRSKRSPRRPIVGREDWTDKGKEYRADKGKEDRTDKGRGYASENSYPRYSGRRQGPPPNGRRFQSNLDN